MLSDENIDWSTPCTSTRSISIPHPGSQSNNFQSVVTYLFLHCFLSALQKINNGRDEDFSFGDAVNVILESVEKRSLVSRTVRHIMGRPTRRHDDIVEITAAGSLSDLTSSGYLVIVRRRIRQSNPTTSKDPPSFVNSTC